MNSRDKGKRGERLWAEFLRDHGWTQARRGQQYRGGEDSPDVVEGIPGTHCEVKFRESLNIYAAMHQAQSEARAGNMPYVAHKRNRTQWLVTITGEDFVELMAFLESRSPSRPASTCESPQESAPPSLG